MSTLSQFAGGGVKSIQRGTIAPSSVSFPSTATATISAVDPAKSFISSSCQSGFTSGAGFVSRIELTSSTQVTATSPFTGSGTSSIVSWEVIELY